MCGQKVLRSDRAQHLQPGTAHDSAHRVLALAVAVCAAAGAADALDNGAYGNFDIIFDHFPRISQLHPTPHAPCAMPCLVPMLIGC